MNPINSAPSAWEPKIVAFLCNWCSYAGADLAGTSRIQYPPNLRVIRVPCSGRVNPLYIVRALYQGADGVLVSGCHPGDCHYTSGNYYARRKLVLLKRLLEFVGIEPERLQFSWVSASEGGRFAAVVEHVVEQVRRLGPRTGLEFPAEPGPVSAGAGIEGVRQVDGASAGDAHDSPPEVSFRGGPSSSPRDPDRDSEFMSAERRLRDVSRELLARGEVDVMIGFGRGTLASRTAPLFVRTPEEAEGLVWNPFCTNSLAKYLCRREGRAGIIAKPCDARAIVNYIREGQVERDRLRIVGLVCSGLAVDSCKECVSRTPPIYDILIGTNGDANGADCYNDVREFEARPLAERRESFRREAARCILCYACRNVCHACNCPVCFVNRGGVRWTPAPFDAVGAQVFHLVRAFHMAGRCVGCGACERACPAGVNLGILVRKAAKDVEELFGAKPGLSLEERPALADFSPDDPDLGFVELGGNSAVR